MITAVQLGEKLRSLRVKSKISQAQLSNYLGVDQSMVSKFENGERHVTSDIIDKLSKLYCISINDLLSGEEVISSFSIAFRSSDLDVGDLDKLAIINKIALNQFEMDRINRG